MVKTCILLQPNMYLPATFVYNLQMFMYVRFPIYMTLLQSQSLWAHLHVVGMLPSVYVLDTNQASLPPLFYSVLVSVSVFMALSTVFHSINSPNNSLLSHSVLPVLSLPYWSFQLYISL